MRSGLFTGANEAKVGGGGVYFLDGIYRVEVVRAFVMQSRKKEDLFIAEFKILESDNDARRAGMRCSWCVSLKQDAALGNIKGFVAAATDTDPEDDQEDWEEAIEMAVSKDNPLAGAIVDLEATTVKTRAGNDFTKHTWSPVSK